MVIMPKICFFRCDSSAFIGLGHVIRCLTLAKALRARGVECRFICREHEGNLLERIRQEGFDVMALPHISKANTDKVSAEPILAHADWLGADWQTDAQQTIDALSCEPDWLIVDHYALDKRWEEQLRPYTKKIIVIDDLADRDHVCDLLLDQNLVADQEHRYDNRVPQCCACLSGPQYALLQPEYAELHPRTPPRLGPVRRILVSFGGADQHNLTGLSLSAFQALQRCDIALDVVINSQSPHAAAIRAQAQGHANTTVYDTLPSLAPLMLKADLAIGAGGATSWERCCLGLPSLVITLAENQKPISAALEQHGLVRWLGHYDTVTEPTLTHALQATIEDSGLEEWSKRCMALVDGKGVERVAAIMTLDGNTPLDARLARLEDEALLLRWANDPLVRQNAFNPENISEEMHREWFYRRLRDPERCRIYIVETEECLPIGQVRIERNDRNWEVHYSLAPVARKRGVGHSMLTKALSDFAATFPNTELFARVKKDNKPSKNIFKRIGFFEQEEVAEFLYSAVLNKEGHVCQN